MSRNMTNANRLLFERLIRSAPDGLRENIAHQLSRWVESSDYDKEIIKYSTVDASDLGAGCHGALVSNARLGKLWAILPGQPDLSQLDNQIRGASLVDLNAGWMTLLGSQEWFLIKEDRYQREQIVDLLGDREGAYSFEEIQGFYAGYHIIDVSSVPRSSDHDDLLLRIAAASELVGCTYKLAFDESIAPILLELLDADVSALFSSSIYRSITASHWVHAYLELYRCIEYYYPVTYVEELAGALGISGHESLGKSIVQILNWKPHEEHALTRLLSKVDLTSLQVLATSFNADESEGINSDSLSQQLAKIVYKTRNSIAHHRVGLKGLPNTDWNQAIRGLCCIVRELQKLYPEEKKSDVL
jgi:hypothetical protein